MRAVLVCSLLLVLAAAGQAAVFQVPSDFASIQLALNAALSGDSVLVAPGFYTGLANTDLTFDGKAIALIGTAGPEQTVISASVSWFGTCLRFFHNEPREALVQGFTLRDSNSPYAIGAINCAPGCSPTLRDLIVTANHALMGSGYDTAGAGLNSYNGSPRVENVVFTDNQATGGGAVYCQGGDAVFTDCRFENNRGHIGGALSAAGGRYERCVFTGNEAVHGYLNEDLAYPGFGGAVEVGGETDFVECVFVDNIARNCGPGSLGPSPGRGGAVCVRNAGSETVPTFNACTFVGNLAEDVGGELAGGSIDTDSERVVPISTCIFSGTLRGYAVYAKYGSAAPQIECSLFWDNRDGHFGGGCPDLLGENHNFAADPLFCDLPAHDLHVAGNSPCLPDNNLCGVQIGALGRGCGETAAEAPPPAAGFALASHPNPFNPSTTIRFTLAATAAVTLSIHDLAGRRVATLRVGEWLEAGLNCVAWDGRLDTGGRATSGVYLARLAAAGCQEAHKLVLLR